MLLLGMLLEKNWIWWSQTFRIYLLEQSKMFLCYDLKTSHPGWLFWNVLRLQYINQSILHTVVLFSDFPHSLTLPRWLQSYSHMKTPQVVHVRNNKISPPVHTCVENCDIGLICILFACKIVVASNAMHVVIYINIFFTNTTITAL